MYRLAHLSDPHVPPERRPRRRELLSKRAIGWTNWRRRRHRVHRREVLDVLTGDLAAACVDHVAITGDLTVVSSRAEWEACRAWLASVGPPADVSIIPGNHDAYTRRAVPGTAKAWRAYMSNDGDLGTGDHEFPYFRRRGPLAIVGCSSAVATAPFLATGKLGTSQLERVEAMLLELAGSDLFRVVLIHHPPVGSSGDRYRRLTDGRAFSRILARAGADLVLHGHDHLASVKWLPGADRPIPVVGVPSASALAYGNKPAAGYNIYDIGGEPGRWTCSMTVRGFDGAAVTELSSHMLLQGGEALAVPIIAR